MLSAILLSLLAGLYPAVFFVSNNYFVFPKSQIVFLLIAMPLLSAAFLMLFYFVISFITRITTAIYDKEGRLTIISKRLRNSFFGVISLSLSTYFLRNTLISLPLNKIFIWFLVFGVISLLSVAVYKRGLKFLNACLGVLTVLAVANFFSNIIFYPKSIIGPWLIKNKPVYDQIKFSKKSNVYFIIAESYPSEESLKTIYKINNNEFYEKLEALRFKMYPSTFSNYECTISSMLATFSMAHHYSQLTTKSFDGYGGRELICAQVYNPVIDIFKRNGYLVQYLHEHNYMLIQGAGASIDYYYPKSSNYAAFLIFITDQRLSQRNMWEKAFTRKRREEFHGLIQDRISVITAQNQPYFTFIFVNSPTHSPAGMDLPKTENARREILRRFRQNFYRNIKDANYRITYIINQILAQDKDALIIIAGDHGAYGYRNNETATGTPISPNMIGLDRLGTLLAIRFPQDYNLEYEHETLTNVNLFRYVFSYLSGTREIMNTRVPDDGYTDKNTMAARDGKLLDDFIKTEPPNIFE